MEEKIPHSQREKSPPKLAKRWWRKSIAYLTAGLLATSTGFAAAGPAMAAPEDVSEALGKFLGGDAVGIDLDDIAEISGAFAENPSGENPIAANPLGADVLNAIGVDLGDSLQLFGPNGVIALGAVSQYGQAESNGDALAASGAVSDQGGISIGGPDAPPANASINLDALLPAGTEGLVNELSLELGALSSLIEQTDGGTPVSEYQIAGATLNLESPAVGSIYTTVVETVDDLQTTLNGLSDTIEGLLSNELDIAIANLSVDVDFDAPDLSTVLPESTVGESGGVIVDLQTGAVTVDLEALLAADEDLPNLNAMPANSQLLSGEIVAAIADGITNTVAGIVADIAPGLDEAISATTLNVDVSLGASFPVVGTIEVLGVGLGGNLGEIQDGQGNLDVRVASGVPGVGTLINEILSLLGLGDSDALGDLVFGIVGGVVSGVFDTLSGLEDILDPVTGTVATEVVGPVLDVVNQVVAVTVNAQPETGDLGEDSSTVRALQVSLLPATTLAQVNLASSTVRGTNAAVLDPSVTVTPDQAQPGDEVSIEGSGYTPDSTVTVEITDEDSNVIDTLEDVPTDGDGNFSTEWTVPEGIDPGELTVTATDDTDPEASDSGTLTILDEDGAFDTSIALEPSTVEQGEVTEVTGSGFAPGEDVTVSIPGAEEGDDPITVTTEADEDGNFTVDLPIPGDYPTGDVTVEAVGVESETPATADLTVGEATGDPEGDPTGDPEGDPAGDPEGDPVGDPEGDPTGDPEGDPTGDPEGDPVGDPEGDPTGDPEGDPAGDPEGDPTGDPEGDPTGDPEGDPTGDPEGDPTGDPEGDPTGDPEGDPVGDPEGDPTGDPEGDPTGDPEGDPTGDPEGDPTGDPEGDPTGDPEGDPVGDPEGDPEGDPTGDPEGDPTGDPEGDPTGDPEGDPVGDPEGDPTGDPEGDPTGDPEGDPTGDPEGDPTGDPEGDPTGDPEGDPTGDPEGDPVGDPEGDPTGDPDGESDLDPSVTIDPEQVEPGDSVEIEGSGYTPDSTVTVEITDSEGNVVDTIEGVETNGDGEFSTDWTVPEGTDPGELTVTVTDDTDPEASVEVTLTIIDPTGDPEGDPAGDPEGDPTGDPDGESDLDPSVTIDPEQVEPGDSVEVEGSGYTPDSTVTVEITDSEGNVVDSFTVDTDDEGSFTSAWTIPADMDAGELTVTVTDDTDTEQSASAVLTVVDPDAAGGGSETETGDGLASTGASTALGLVVLSMILLLTGFGITRAVRTKRADQMS